MPYHILYSGDSLQDVKNLAVYIDEFYAEQRLAVVDVSLEGLWGVIGAMTQQFPSNLEIDEASPFKKVAAFTTYFTANRPVVTELPNYGQLASHQNAILAYMLSRDALHGAVIRCPRRGSIVLSEPILVSGHYWRDLIVAFSSATPVHHFNYVSLIYEALAYQANPGASYDKLI